MKDNHQPERHTSGVVSKYRRRETKRFQRARYGFYTQEINTIKYTIKYRNCEIKPRIDPTIYIE